jgi:hypothetical protein
LHSEVGKLADLGELTNTLGYDSRSRIMTIDGETGEEPDLPRPPEQLDLDAVIDRMLDEGLVIENEVEVCVLGVGVAGFSGQAFVRSLDWAPDDARPAVSGWLKHELQKIREREQRGGG